MKIQAYGYLRGHEEIAIVAVISPSDGSSSRTAPATAWPASSASASRPS